MNTETQVTKENVEAMIQLQTRRFTEQINEPLKSNCSIKLKFYKELLVNAKVNTTEKLNGIMLDMLIYICNSWQLGDIEISRSGAGLKIEFNPDKKQK